MSLPENVIRASRIAGKSSTLVCVAREVGGPGKYAVYEASEDFNPVGNIYRYSNWNAAMRKFCEMEGNHGY